MTAEIAVMNRQGIALAADSAVTVDLPRGQKIYNTVNKLFALSKRAPVGVMIYGSAQVSGVPWETVVKEFRRDLGDQKLPTIQAYADAFFSFMESGSTLFPREQEVQELAQHAVGIFSMILDQIKASWQSTIDAQGSIRAGQARRAVTEVIRGHLTEIEATPSLAGYPSDYCTKIQTEFKEEITEWIDLVFEKIPLGVVGRRRLTSILCQFMMKEVFPSVVSGIVFAGFGETEHFPVMLQYDTQCVLLGKVKTISRRTCTINAEIGAGIYPFAQSEMVGLFMEGVDENYRRVIVAAIEGFLQGLPNVILSGLSLSAADERSFTARMATAAKQIVEGFSEELTRYSRENNVDPIIDAVAVLPKEELAEMAESLVNLTSFKRRVTADPETVGGPIDVAVISKGDGFIWIKRKHYFSPELNHHFFSNYF